MLRSPISRGLSFPFRRHSTFRRKHGKRNESMPPFSSKVLYSGAALLVFGTSVLAYYKSPTFKHGALSVLRCSRVAGAAILGAIDYKLTLTRSYTSEAEEAESLRQCHLRSASRTRDALLRNGGIFIKLGQHMSSLIVLPVEWTSTLRPLLDRCDPTPYEDLENLCFTELGSPIDEVFIDLLPEPVGVASLAQVHVGHLRETNQKVAVKVQHPHLAEFCDIDMEMVEATLGWIKYWFPEFELTWLGEEMRQNLPKEMDFVHEARNASRAGRDFENVRTSLYVPKVVIATRRVLVMEYIQGGRIDDLAFLAEFGIDRNKVALELSRIFNRMVFINGFFHADPHLGNLLIRPASSQSKSPYNFEICLLDHGLYFDLDRTLRVNYGRLWLSLIAPGTPATLDERRRCAKAVADIGSDLYPVFEAALTGRASLQGSWEDEPKQSSEGGKTFGRATSMIDMLPQSREEVEAIRYAVMNREGLLVSVLDLLRRIPRRILMVLKLNDLTRSLDHALMTTHSNVRIFLIMAKYCTVAVWNENRRRVIDNMRERGLFSLGLLREYFTCWWSYETSYVQFVLAETVMDAQAHSVKFKDWLRGFRNMSFKQAHLAASGLA